MLNIANSTLNTHKLQNKIFEREIVVSYIDSSLDSLIANAKNKLETFNDIGDYNYGRFKNFLQEELNNVYYCDFHDSKNSNIDTYNIVCTSQQDNYFLIFEVRKINQKLYDITYYYIIE